MGWAGETTPEVLVESLRAIDGIDVHDLLGRIAVPTLALHGTQDKIVPYSHAQKMVAAIPGRGWSRSSAAATGSSAARR